MRLFSFIIAFLFSFKNLSFAQTQYSQSAEGCGNITCHISNGINISGHFPSLPPSGIPDVDTAYIQNEDSIILNLSRVGGCDLYGVQITVNDVVVNYRILDWPIGNKLKIPGSAGKYVIWGPVIQSYCTFVLVMNPVGLKENSKIDESIKIYPNPAFDFFSVRSEKEFLKNVSIKNNLGQLIKSIDLDIDRLDITRDLPTGIYFLHVTTRNDKLSISKIVIE